MTTTTSGLIEALEAFQREERFIVIKRKHLVDDEERKLRDFLYELNVGTVECVVVESDWPEYETVWKMIEDRVTGRAPAATTPDAGEAVAWLGPIYHDGNGKPEWVPDEAIVMLAFNPVDAQNSMTWEFAAKRKSPAKGRDWEAATAFCIEVPVAHPTAAVAGEREIERVAVALWKEEARRAAPNVAKYRDARTFLEQSDDDLEAWRGRAKAAIAALSQPAADALETEKMRAAIRAILLRSKMNGTAAEIEETADQIAVLSTPPRQPDDGVWEAFLPMAAWDRRNETVLLLVDYTDGDHPLDDDTIAITIGHNNDHNVGDGEGNGWQFAGWCWTHDHYVEGKGKPIGWMPLPHCLAALAKAPEAQKGEGLGADGCDYCRNDGPLIRHEGHTPRCPRCDAEYPNDAEGVSHGE